MNKLQGMMGLSLVALLLGSCTSNSQLSKNEVPTQKPSVAENSVKAKSATVSAADAAAPVQGLISASNPIEIPIAQGRRDPFGSVAVTPISQQVGSKPTEKTPLKPQPDRQKSTEKTPLKPQPDRQKSTEKTPLKPQPDRQKSTQDKPGKTQPESKRNIFTVDKKTTSQPESAPQPINPTPPELDKTNSVKPLVLPSPSTELADAVEIKGVMQVGGNLSAIIKEPNQKAHYVRQGEYLSKGAVLVKRIELVANQEPRVILEQNGIEVVKPVSSDGGAVASLP